MGSRSVDEVVDGVIVGGVDTKVISFSCGVGVAG
jgi:hypothetical protein